MSHLDKSEYTVADLTQSQARNLVERYHYARGMSNTAVFRHGLFRVGEGEPLGCAVWLPPTKQAALSVAGDDWRAVLSLSRLVVVPGMPTNAASFLMGRSMRIVRRDQRWRHVVTYADEGEGHTGAIYLATNWESQGVTSKTPRWRDPETGKLVATLATKTRTAAEMRDLGYVREEPTAKRRFVMHFEDAAA